MNPCVSSAELEELLLSLKQVRGCLSDQQSQNDVELVLALLNKVTEPKSEEGKTSGTFVIVRLLTILDLEVNWIQTDSSDVIAVSAVTGVTTPCHCHRHVDQVSLLVSFNGPVGKQKIILKHFNDFQNIAKSSLGMRPSLYSHRNLFHYASPDRLAVVRSASGPSGV